MALSGSITNPANSGLHYEAIGVVLDGFDTEIVGADIQERFACDHPAAWDAGTGRMVITDVSQGTTVTCTVSLTGYVPYDGNVTAYATAIPVCDDCAAATAEVTNHTDYLIKAPAAMTIVYTNGNDGVAQGDDRTYAEGDLVTLKIVITNLRPQHSIDDPVITGLSPAVLAALSCDVDYLYVEADNAFGIADIPPGGTVTCTAQVSAELAGYVETATVNAQTDQLMCVGERVCVPTPIEAADPTNYAVTPTSSSTSYPTTTPETTPTTTEVPVTTGETTTTLGNIAGPTTTTSTTARTPTTATSTSTITSTIRTSVAGSRRSAMPKTGANALAALPIGVALVAAGWAAMGLATRHGRRRRRP